MTETLEIGDKRACDDGKCKWKAAILILCLVGILKEFRPSGPFLVDYAVDHGSFTPEEVTHQILPATTGSYIISLLLLLLVTDVLCYKPMIVLGGVATVCTWVTTIWAFDTIALARTRQSLYGISAMTTEVAYFTYMYANIEKKDYKKVTSYTHSAVHFGQFLSGVTGQVLLSLHIMEIPGMNYLSLGGAVGSLVLSLLLPRILRDPHQISDKDKDKEANNVPQGLNYTRNLGQKRPSPLKRWKEAPHLAKQSIKYAYSSKEIIKYSMWWALAYGLYIQVDLYIESLWKEIEHHSHQKVWNGAVHASHAIISVVLGLIVGRTKLCWKTWACGIFGLGTVFQAISLFVMSQTHDLYKAYAAFIVFQTCFQVLVIVSKSHVAELIKEGTEAFIFGMNTLLACLIHGLLTLAFSGRFGFQLPIKDQYIVYTVYAVLLGVGFFLYSLPRKIKEAKARRNGGGYKEDDIDREKGDGEDMQHLDISPNQPYSIPREH